VRPNWDAKALTDLIAVHVAPGTWATDGDFAADPNSDTNRMIPFKLSCSLIVSCPSSVHDQVAKTLHMVRALLQARDEFKLALLTQPVSSSPIVPAKSATAPPVTSPPHADAADPDLPTTPTPPATKTPMKLPGSMERMEQLLRELRQELAKFRVEP
jgi:hypothetical protein